MDNIKNAFDIWPELAITNINDVINYLKKEQITNLSFDNEYKKNDFLIIATDKKHPFFQGNQLIKTTINNSFYKKYKDRIDTIINENIEKEKEETYSGKENTVYIREHIYDEELIRDMVKKNPNVSILFKGDVTLSENIINFLQKHHIKATLDGEEISKNTILGYNNYYDIVNGNKNYIYVDYNSPKEEARYVPNNIKVEIKAYDGKIDFDEYLDKIYNLASAFREYGYNNEIRITCFNREKLENSKFKDGELSNILVKTTFDDFYPLEKALDEGKILNLMAKEVNKPEYSPLEKFIAAFNIDKQYKEYRESPNHPSESRALSKILDNEYMVCVGYGNLLRELLDRAKIGNMKYRTTADTSYDDGFSEEEKPVNYVGHDRTLVYIDDPKYNIHGTYVSDPTWDNDLDRDLYNHALMSIDKTGMEKRLMPADRNEFLFNAHDENEWYEKLIFFLNRGVNQELGDQERTIENVKKSTLIQSSILVIDIMDYFENLNPEAYKTFKDKRPNSLHASIEEYDEFFKEAGKVIVSMVGKDIPLETIVKAGMVSREASIPKKDLLIFEKQVLFENIEREKSCFPSLEDEERKEKAR